MLRHKLYDTSCMGVYCQDERFGNLSQRESRFFAELEDEACDKATDDGQAKAERGTGTILRHRKHREFRKGHVRVEPHIFGETAGQVIDVGPDLCAQQ